MWLCLGVKGSSEGKQRMDDILIKEVMSFLWRQGVKAGLAWVSRPALTAGCGMLHIFARWSAMAT